jgi:hypothetical protein
MHLHIYIYIYTKILARDRFAQKNSRELGDLRDLRNLRDLRGFGCCWPAAAAGLCGGPPSRPLGRSKGLLAPARCPRGARMGRSSPRSVPAERSKGLLEPPLDAPRALEGAARAPAQCPEGARRGCSSLLGAPGGSKWLLKPLLGTSCALRAAFRPPARCCRGRSSYLLCHWALDKAFENAARRICPRLHLSSVALHSAPHYTVHGYARVHTSIYIYIYIYIFVFPPC